MKKLGTIIAGIAVVAFLALFAWYSGQDSPLRLAGGNERDVRNIGEYDLERLYPDIILRTGKNVGKLVCLTFDDGPDDVYTPAVLDILKEKDVKATFFLIGKRVEEFPEVAKRIANEGHLVGNHSYSHADLDKASSLMEQELTKAQAAFKKLGFSDNYIFRPAYGAANPSIVEQVANLGYKVAMWSVDSLDWTGLSAAEVFRNVSGSIVPGAVVLQHSSGGPGEDLSGSVTAIPQIIDDLRAKGYRFVTMDEMFKLNEPGP